MLDPHLLRNNIDEVARGLTKRGVSLDVGTISNLESRRKFLQSEVQELQSQRNSHAKRVGQAKGRGEDVSQMLLEVKNLAAKLKNSEARLGELMSSLEDIYKGIPNIPHESVPAGQDEEDNLEVRRVGEPKEYSFQPRDHVDLGIGLGGMDFDSATKIAGSRFVVMSGVLARLQRALTQFMLDLHTGEHGYLEIYCPYIVNRASLYGTGQLPKFEEDQFKLEGEEGYFLIPTAEVPVTNLVRDKILEPEELPLRFVCHTPCFRREAGSYGRDTRGMIRQHQFEKVELVHVVRPEQSYATLESLTGHAEKVLMELEIPYRVVTLCGGDLGFSSAKTYDIEVWLPGQNKYREISSCSNFESFQARRMMARWRNPDTGNTEYVHTLNGSGLAVGRTLVAVMENYQNPDGSITIPGRLRSYVDGLRRIDSD